MLTNSGLTPTDDSEPCPAPALLDWQTVHQKMQWNVLLILGGGFALAESCKVRVLVHFEQVSLN